jgi:3-carboxy-cis,cis-muconate cycloisomerase
MTNLLWPGDQRAGELMTDQVLLRSMVVMESAWLTALADAGLAPAECARADLGQLVRPQDCELLGVSSEDGGNPVIGLVAVLRERAVPAVGRWIHRGLTSQDVVDTGLMLAVRAAVDGLTSALAEQVSTLSATELAALLQPAANPAEVSTHLARTTATILGLDHATPWHTTRAPLTAVADALVGCTDAWGRIASYVVIFARPEIAELSEPVSADRGGSSTMPQKRNPVLSVLIRRTAISAPPLAATLHTAAALAKNLAAADIWGEQQAIAEFAVRPPSATHWGAVDSLVDESLDRARRIVKEHS